MSYTIAIKKRSLFEKSYVLAPAVHCEAVYEPITDTYRIGADIAIFANNRFSRYGKCLSVSVIGIGRYKSPYRLPCRYAKL